MFHPEDEDSKKRGDLDKIWFESKTESTNAYRNWAKKVLSALVATDILAEAGLREALDISLSMTRSHTDLELLVLRWSVEAHTFVTLMERVHSHLGRCFSDFCLPMLTDEGATSLDLFEEEERML